MTGIQSTIVSPCSLRTRRKTPCVLGCWGPILSSISWDLISSACSADWLCVLLSSCIDIVFALSFDVSLVVDEQTLFEDLLAQLEEALNELLRTRWTARHVDIDRHDGIDALDRVVTIVEFTR